MDQMLGALADLPEDLSSAPTSGSSQMPVTLGPWDPILSPMAVTGTWTHMHKLHIDACMHTYIHTHNFKK